MFKLLGKIPTYVHVAFSGGVDSVAIVDFLSRKHNITCVWFDHKTSDSESNKQFVEDFCNTRGIELIIGEAKRSKNTDESLEEYWRNVRYEFLDFLDVPIITAHNLDDCLETYIHSSFHGKAKIIPYNRRLVYRPFLLNRKEKFVEWATRKNLSWFEDASNDMMNLTRNKIRKNIVPLALEVNPGLYKTISKIVIEKFN